MQAILPLAGKGTRLRPHTHTRPKPLLRVANRPVLDYVLRQLEEVGVDINQRGQIEIDEQGRNPLLRQTGGKGQFGHCKVRVRPITDDDFRFNDEIKGGVIPRDFIRSVEQGVREAMETGPLAGYPMNGIELDLYDGSHHEVDSSEVAFKIAASMGFRDGALKADPVLLEPIMKVEVVTPEDYMGDVMGDLNRRRGLPQGMDDSPSGKIIRAEVPLAEMFGYATDLRSMSQGRAVYSMEFEKYSEVPQNVADTVMKKAS